MGQPLPYVPMRAPEKPVTQEDMWAKLSKNAKAPLEALVPPKEPLKWEKPVRTGERSGYMLEALGRWSITKDANETGVTYTAWRRATRTKSEVNLGCVFTREEAERLCNEDSQRT